MKAVVLTDQNAGLAGMKLMERPSSSRSQDSKHKAQTRKEDGHGKPRRTD